jgi:uncharacterized protein (DUF3084 family)
MELEQEKFNTVKALAEMQMQIATGTAELKRIERAKDEYMALRSAEGDERVARVLEESRDALEQTTKNHDELSRYGNELKAFASTLKSFSTQIVALSQHFREWMEREDAVLDEKRDALVAEKKEMKILAVNIQEDRKQLKRESDRVADEMRLLEDRRGLLERGFAELNRNKQQHG